MDNSKSIWRLLYLLCCRNINLKVIYLKRDIFGNISSYVKHNISFWRGLFTYKIQNYLIKKILKNKIVDYIPLNYNKFCKNPKTELKKLEILFKIDLSDYVNKVKKTNFHVPTGNIGTREKLKNFTGLRLDNSWKNRLSILQKRILKILE